MRDDAVKLRDGRALGYCVDGPEDGFGIFVFHGWGGSRLTRHPDRAVTEALGIRLITVDRPGVGASDPLPDRTILSWSSDVAELADHLLIERFAVLGHSAGAPYALACAYSLDDRVTSATIVSGIGTALPEARLFASDMQTISLLLHDVPTFTKSIFKIGRRVLVSEPAGYMYRSFAKPYGADRGYVLTAAMKEMRIRSLREAFRQGIDGIYDDALLIMGDWGFDPSAIQRPVRIWHGESDTIVDISFARQLAEELSDCTSIFIRDPGHHLLYSHWEQILRMAAGDLTSEGNPPDGCEAVV